MGENSSYTPKELATLLDVHFTEVYQYIASGILLANNKSRGSQRARWSITSWEAERFMKEFQKYKHTGKLTRERIEACTSGRRGVAHKKGEN